ncbi:MAG: hypothetical protein ACLP62_15490 [Acidimicrobiales bacterium]
MAQQSDLDRRSERNGGRTVRADEVAGCGPTQLATILPFPATARRRRRTLLQRLLLARNAETPRLRPALPTRPTAPPGPRWHPSTGLRHPDDVA